MVGEHLAGMGDEEPQDVVIPSARLHLGIAHPDDPSHEIDREVARLEDRPLALLLQPVAERGTDAGDELVHAERLRHVVVRTEVERLDLAALVAAAGEHDDRRG
jgi:hypothetical protein